MQSQAHTTTPTPEQQTSTPKTTPLLTLNSATIRDVYRDNFEQQMQTFLKLVESYNCISMDTEFPGINISNQYVQWLTPDQAEHEYHVLKQNVDNSRLIQIGLTLADENGRVPQGVCTWQFNFEFLLEQDMINEESHSLLTRAGISFERLREQGISVNEFSDYLVSSGKGVVIIEGLLLNPKVRWVVFHGGYDFAYLLKMVHGQGLPQSSQQFYNLMHLYYPNVCDLKYSLKDIPRLRGAGLAKLASKIRVSPVLIQCRRIGPPHQAGSDSLLTMSCYFKLREMAETEEVVRGAAYLNILYGVGPGYVRNSYGKQNVQNQQPQPQQSYDETYLSYTPYYYVYPQQMYYMYQPNSYPSPTTYTPTYLYPQAYQ